MKTKRDPNGNYSGKRPKLMARTAKIMATRTARAEVGAVDVTESEVDAVSILGGGGGGGVEALAAGPLNAIAAENGEITERGMARVRGVVKFLSGLLNGMRHKAALESSGLIWAQVNVFMMASPEFAEMYERARSGMKRAMGSAVLDTAFDLATEGEVARDKDGIPLGYRKKSEKMLDRMLALSGAEFRKDGGGGQSGGVAEGSGITLNLHFDGKGRPGAEVVDVG